VSEIDQIGFWNGPAGERWARAGGRMDAVLGPIGELGLGVLEPLPGARVLDVGCGTGTTTLGLAERVGPGGGVLGIDVSRPMLEVARARAGASGVRFLEADAAGAALPEVDRIFSRFGVMFFDDPLGAFANLARALAPGGAAAFVVWREREANPWLTRPGEAVEDLLDLGEPPPEGGPGPFSLGDGARFRRVLDEAGFAEVDLRAVDVALRLGADVADAVELTMDGVGPVARAVSEAPSSARGAVAERLGALFAAWNGPMGVAAPGAVWVATARAPSRPDSIHR